MFTRGDDESNKVIKLFKDFDKNVARRRKVEIYHYDDLVFAGMVADIPDELKNKTLRTWCNMLNIVPQTLDNCCDEDVNGVNVEMVLTVFVVDKE